MTQPQPPDVQGGEPSPLAVRSLDRLEDLRAAESLFAATWPGQAPATTALLKALVHAGGYVAGAFLGTDMLGAAAGFLAAHPRPALHSHLAAVLPAARGHGVGYVLKRHQREWAREQGLTAVTWTFDPLVRRNAWFNITKLGAGIEEYLVDFYGRMDDGVNDGDESDRLLAVWPVADDDARAFDQGQFDQGQRVDAPGLEPGREPAVTGIAVAVEEVAGRPVARGVEPHAALVSVGTPADVETLRRIDADVARAWRLAVRAALAPRMARGRVVGFTRAGSYLVRSRG